MELPLQAAIAKAIPPAPRHFPARIQPSCSSEARIPSEDLCRRRWRCRCRNAGAVRSIVRSETVIEDQARAAMSAPAAMSLVRLFVGLPFDAVSPEDGNTVNHARAISAGMRALKRLGADGVELPVWWCVAQPDRDRFEWNGYLALARAARDAGLAMRVSLLLHSSAAFPLPRWLTDLAGADPDVFFTDRSDRRRRDCLPLAVDDLPVLGGMTAAQAYRMFFSGFRSAFSDLFGSTITDITVGLGQAGELRYPSHPPSTEEFTGVGEFQCYDKYMLADLKKHAEASGRPLWGLTGPHDAPGYGESPDSGGFFKDHGGSWESPYGEFFLSWYSDRLLAHGDRILSLTSKVFDELPVRVSGKVPLAHSWHLSRSRPSQLTAGYYNVAGDGRDGYAAVAEVFARNSCAMVVPGMDISGEAAESLTSQIVGACRRRGVPVSSPVAGAANAGGFRRVRECLAMPVVGSFTYQRMGAEFFSPEHWPMFVQFVRSMTLPELDADDIPAAANASSSPAKDREMMAA